MPIKFRCSYCRQFLGISRAQAGGIVDCPTCGRSIRVPMLDGTLQPLPEPELNIQDIHLARALDELARLANLDDLPSAPAAEKANAGEVDEDDENAIPQPIPEPIPIEVPIPPTPIVVQAPVQEDVPLVAATNGAAGSAGDAAAAILGREQSVLAELASLPVPITPNESVAARRSFEGPRASSSSSVPRVSIIVVVTFLAGMMFERFVKVLESLRPTMPASTIEPTKGTPEPVTQVTGRITFKSADGRSQPDRGAKIVALPQQREGEIKLSVTGLRPSDSEVDANVAAAAVHALNGAAATADDAGMYHLDLPAGNYHLLVLSHFQPRGDKEPLDPTSLKLLSAYVDKPEELFGRVKYYFGPLKVKGAGDVWDYSF